MKKIIMAAIILGFTTPAYASSVANDQGFKMVIAKYVAKETAQRDMQEALKVVRAVRIEQKLARKKKVR